MAKRTGQKTKNEYNCEQNELYAVCILIYVSLKNKIADFVKYKTFYTLQFVADRVAEVMAAGAIPVFQARNKAAEMLRVQLMKKSDECVNKWQYFKGYITEAFPKDVLQINLDAAGYQFYEQAINYNWEKVMNLMNAASAFISENKTVLEANNNMPTTFQAEFNQLIPEISNLYVEFQEAMTTSISATTEKIGKNNDIFKKAMKVCKDGQQIYRYDHDTKDLFTFTTVLQRVRGASSAFQELEVPKNSSIRIKKLVANTPFANIGETDLVVCIGDVTCTVGTGTTVPAGATIIMGEDVTTITVLNTDIEHKGLCKTRVIKK